MVGTGQPDVRTNGVFRRGSRPLKCTREGGFEATGAETGERQPACFRHASRRACSRSRGKPARHAWSAGRVAAHPAVSRIVVSSGRYVIPVARTRSMFVRRLSPASHRGSPVHGSTPSDVKNASSTHTGVAASGDAAAHADTKARIVSGSAGPVTLKAPERPASVAATIQSARSRTSMN